MTKRIRKKKARAPRFPKSRSGAGHHGHWLLLGQWAVAKGRRWTRKEPAGSLMAFVMERGLLERVFHDGLFPALVISGSKVEPKPLGPEDPYPGKS